MSQSVGERAGSVSPPLPRPADLPRLVEIGAAFGRAGIGAALREGALVFMDPLEHLPKATAAALREAFEDLGPAFLKLGQFIASSPGLFPQVLVSEFRKVLDDVQPESPAAVRRVLSLTLGKSPDEMFADFEWEPVAAASMAQVHSARLRDGRRVAVKVRRPGLRRQVERDLRMMKLAAVALGRAGPLSQAVDLLGLIEDFESTLYQEMDFRREAESMALFGINLRGSSCSKLVVCPEPVWDLVDERVLVMSYIEGLPLSRLLSDHETTGTALVASDEAVVLLRAGVRAWYESVVLHGLFHGDVHAGNIFLVPGGQVAFLDFGIVGRLDDDVRMAIRAMVEAMLLEGDFAAVLSALQSLGATEGIRDLGHAAGDLAAIVAPLRESSLEEISYGEVIVELLDVARKHGVRLPRELALLAKQLLYFEGYAKKLAPDYKILGDTELWDVSKQLRL